MSDIASIPKLNVLDVAAPSTVLAVTADGSSLEGVTDEALAGRVAAFLPGGDSFPASDVTFDPASSGLSATDVQAAIDELASAGGAVSSVNGQTGTVVLDAADVGAAPATPSVGTSLGTSGTVDLDLAALNGTLQTITASGNLTFTTSNRAAGRALRLRIAAGGSSRTLAWPSWVAYGSALPTSLASGKVLRVAIECHGTADTDIDAATVVSV